MPDLLAARDFAASLAEDGRRIALEHFRHPLDVDRKGDDSPVTRADRAIERRLRDRIGAVFPDHGILGEEEDSVGIEQDRIWVIDPIDGTKSFVTGNPLFGNLIGLMIEGEPSFGQIDMPALDERYVGVKGIRTTLNGAPCRTSGRVRLDEAFSYTTDPDLFAADRRSALDALRRETRFVRFGGDCYTYALLAAGHCDLVLETGLQPYDYLPVVAVVENAGGVMTDWRGAPLTMRSGGDVLAAATPELHRAMLTHLRPIADRMAHQAA